MALFQLSGTLRKSARYHSYKQVQFFQIKSPSSNKMTLFKKVPLLNEMQIF